MIFENTQTQEQEEVQNNQSKYTIQITNKGKGAGGANTNLYGKIFETKTNNHNRLINDGFVKIVRSKKLTDYYLIKNYENKNIIFVLQAGFKTYMKTKYNIEVFRCPDEAYIIEYETGKKIIKILEKKEQNVNGSVETKLWSGPSLKREYELVLGEDFEVHYSYCVNEFLKTKLLSNDKKYIILNKIFIENDINVFFGDDENYFENLDKWLRN